MITGIILELSDTHGNNQSDCFIRVSRYDDCSTSVISVLIFILSTIVDGQVLAMLLEVNFNESISKITQDIMIIIMMMMICFILSWKM